MMERNWIMQRAALTPNRIGVTYENQSYTFQEINEHSIKIAKKIAAAGVRQGERVAILAPTSPNLLFVLYACMHLEVEMVLLNLRLSLEEIRYQLEDSEAKLVLYAESESEKLSQVHNKLSFEDVWNLEEADVLLCENWSKSHTTTIMYTSGTTGFPKGVRQTLANHQASAINSVLNLGMDPSDKWICMVPIFHISGFSMLMKSILYGNEVKLYEKFDVEASVCHITKGTATHMSVVGVTLGRILDYMEEHNLFAHESFKCMLAGGSSIPKDYLERAAKLNLNVAQTYGMTETASQTATLSSEDAMRKLGSAGKPLFFNEIKIHGATKPYEEGEIWIRGPHVTPGYVGKFANQAAQIDGFLPSGDIGYLDEDGYLYVVDRRSDLIISGGENIYPAQIENVIVKHEAVQEAGVCGVEDERWGQVPIAFIVRKKEVEERELLEFCEANLASYKVPKKIIFVQELPKNGANKLMRRKLKELYIQ